MLEPTKIYLFIFGLFTIVGGVMGYVKAGSNASLIAGGIAGLLLLVSGYLIMSGKTQPGLILGLVVSIALAGRFLPIFLKTHSIMPAGVTSIMAVIGLVLTILSLVKK
jgi:uncharacterized membrane protein (UPF0136 family)